VTAVSGGEKVLGQAKAVLRRGWPARRPACRPAARRSRGLAWGYGGV